MTLVYELLHVSNSNNFELSV